MRILMSDFSRFFASKKIIRSILLVFSVCMLCLADNFDTISVYDGHDLIYLYNLIMDIGNFKNMIILFSAGISSTLFCDDWNNKFINNIVIRTDIRKYALSKFIVTTVITFSVTFLGIFLFVLLMSFSAPVYNSEYSIEETTDNPYGMLITSAFPLSYILIKIINLSLGCSFWSLFGITFSVFNTNRLLAMVSPFAGYYLASEFTESLPAFFSLRRIMYSYDILNSSIKVTFMYTLLFWMCLSTILFVIFYKNLKRRQENEIT